MALARYLGKGFFEHLVTYTLRAQLRSLVVNIFCPPCYPGHLTRASRALLCRRQCAHEGVALVIGKSTLG
jgi:hypothetical protein